MILDILAKTKIKYLDEVTATYRQLDESASNSRSALKRYTFLKGVYRIQKDYFNKYKLPEIVEEQIDWKYYEAAYPYAVIYDDADTVEKGRQFFKKCSFTNFKVIFALHLSDYYFGKIILRIIYNNRLLKRLATNLLTFNK